MQIEMGVNADYGFFTTSLYGYYKKNRDGFNSTASFLQILLPQYNYTLVPNSKPTYQTTGNYTLYTSLSDQVIGNIARSDNYGVEWFLTSKKIQVIQTSFNMSTSLSYSRSNNVGFSVALASESMREAGKKAWYGIYNATRSSNITAMTKISSDTHIPKLGFVVTVLADIYWKNQQKTLDRSNEPVAYLDRNLNYFPITQFVSTNPDYGYLASTPQAATTLQSPPFVYGNLSFRLAKEIKKHIRFSVYAYNFLNIIPEYQNAILNTFTTYNSPVNVGGEISFKF